MTQPYQLVVFDWEGTLADTIGQVVHILQEKADASGYLPFDEAALRHGLRLGLPNAIRKGFVHLTHEAQLTLLAAVQKALCEKSRMPCLFPGAMALIKQLHARGVKLAIATNKGQHSLHQALQKTQLLDYFVITRAAGQVPSKPHPQMLFDILAACEVAPAQAVMVGDSISDIEMAAAVSMDAVGVDWYEQDAEGLLAAGAKKIVHHYDELVKFLDVTLTSRGNLREI